MVPDIEEKSDSTKLADQWLSKGFQILGVSLSKVPALSPKTSPL